MAASGAGVPMRREVLQLYRSLLRVARQFGDYNIREYSKRRTMDAFRDNKNLRDPSQLSAAFSNDANYLKGLPSLPTRNEDRRDSFLVRCIHDLLDPSQSLYFHLCYLDSSVSVGCEYISSMPRKITSDYSSVQPTITYTSSNENS
ncbi:hypothetical protein PVK06_002597 [Gossypium arboreum]|uniref:Complex 1 LYR protein domain-containing protein n=1 Tax=Gossypium arboreum TaxID=29729 RepID=A0ABR0R454_GOSAR|nr:hypothetical protein PVK06_002597 [Gossypium arboreum]